MGLFGGSKSSSNIEIEETNTNNVDNRVGGDDANNVFGGNQSVVAGDGGGDINLTTTDFGAVQGALDANIAVSSNAFDFSQEAFEGSLSFAGDALGFADDALGSAFASTENAFDLTGDVIEANQKQFKFIAEQTAQQFDRSLAFAEKANTSENAQFLESGVGLLRTGGLFLMAGIGAFVYFNRKA